MAGNVELTIRGEDATKAAFSSAEARATTLNRKFDQLSKRQQGRLRREGRELAQVERAHSGYLREQQRSAAAMAAGNKAAGGWVTSLGLGRIAMVAAAGGAAAFVAKGLAFNKAVESATIKFRAFYPTVELAEKHVKSLTGFAARTPFQLPGVLDASRLMKTFSADAAYGAETLTTVGDAAAGVGAELPNVAMWFGRLYDAAKAGRPFGEASARLQELGLISGTTRTEMEELSKSGASVEEVMALLRDEWGKHEGAMQRLSETTEGLESTFGDLVGQFAGAVVEAAGLSDAYKGLLAGTNELLTASVDLLNGTRDLEAEMAELERRIGAIRSDDTRWGVQDNLEEMRAKLADLKNEKFWEGFNASLETAGETSERVAEEVPAAWEEAGFKSVEAFDKEMKRLSEVAAKEAEEAAAAAVAAFWARAEVESSAMARDSALGAQAVGRAGGDTVCRSGPRWWIRRGVQRRDDPGGRGQPDVRATSGVPLRARVGGRPLGPGGRRSSGFRDVRRRCVQRVGPGRRVHRHVHRHDRSRVGLRHRRLEGRADEPRQHRPLYLTARVCAGSTGLPCHVVRSVDQDEAT